MAPGKMRARFKNCRRRERKDDDEVELRSEG